MKRRTYLYVAVAFLCGISVSIGAYIFIAPPHKSSLERLLEYEGASVNFISLMKELDSDDTCGETPTRIYTKKSNNLMDDYKISFCGSFDYSPMSIKTSIVSELVEDSESTVVDYFDNGNRGSNCSEIDAEVLKTLKKYNYSGYFLTVRTTTKRLEGGELYNKINEDYQYCDFYFIFNNSRAFLAKYVLYNMK